MNFFINIHILVLGLIGLNIIVFIHELGHFLLARAVGINVEVFSLGMGPKIWKKQFKSFEFAISALPLGGYCKMQGESLSISDRSIIKQGDLYYGHPWRRIVTVIAGSLFNFIFAYSLFVVAGMMDSKKVLFSNTILVPKSYEIEAEPLRNNDIILAVNNQSTPYFHDIQAQILSSGDKNILFTIERDNRILTIEKYIALDKDSGLGILPIMPKIPTQIESITPNSPADKAELQIGEIITAIDDVPVTNFYEIINLISEYPDDASIQLTLLTVEGDTRIKNLVLENGTIGIQVTKSQTVKGLALFEALKNASTTFYTTLNNYIHGLKLLLTQQVNIQKSLAGPVQITELIGNIAHSSFMNGTFDILFLLAVLSLTVGFMNLLPIPLLDGGLIVLFIVEIFTKTYSLNSKFLKIYQIIGIIIVILLIILALKSDGTYIVSKFFNK